MPTRFAVGWILEIIRDMAPTGSVLAIKSRICAINLALLKASLRSLVGIAAKIIKRFYCENESSAIYRQPKQGKCFNCSKQGKENEDE